MNDEKLHRNVDDIEFKCNELISEIDHHLTLYGEPQPAITLNNQQTINNDVENIIPDVVITTCHNKLINFTSNHYEAKKIHKSRRTDAVRIHIPKSTCANLTKINQLLVPRTHHSNSETDLLNSNLEVHHLKHVNIDRKLTKQVAFKISCPDERKLTNCNIGTFNMIHENNAVENAKNLEQQTSLDLEKNQPRGDLDEAQKKTYEQNIDTEINIDVTYPKSNEVHSFLYGSICKKNSPKNKRSLKVISRKIKLEKN